MDRLGIQFGDEPLYKHFWAYTPYLRTPEQYLSVMSLTFEMANLDYAPTYGAIFASHGDFESSRLMEKILEDETLLDQKVEQIRHEFLEDEMKEKKLNNNCTFLHYRELGMNIGKIRQQQGFLKMLNQKKKNERNF